MADARLQMMKVFVFTDLVDSMGRKQALGDAGYVEHVAQPHNRIVRELLAEEPEAKVENFTGDGFLMTFPAPSAAVAYALKLHAALAKHEWCEAVRQGSVPAVRIGIHLGEAVEYQDGNGGKTQIAGQATDLAARVMGLATGGRTLMTRHAFDSARQFVRAAPWEGAPPLAWAAQGQYKFQGFADPVEICEVALGEVPQPPPDSDKVKRVAIDAADDTGAWRPAAGLGIPRRDGWKLEAKIGEGGFGEVWLARHHRTKQARVFKFCFDAERLRSFKRELTIFKLIRNELGDRPDIAKLHDVQLDSSPYFLESDYAPEGNLADWAERQQGIGKVPLDTRLRMLAEAARAVAAAHSLGIIHKDLKPSNLLVTIDREGKPHPQLNDFGIGVVDDRATLQKANVTELGFTEDFLFGNESSRTGTRMYAPPEALQGKAATTGGDIYALGVMLFQFASGDLSVPLGVGWEDALDAQDPDRDALLREDIRAATISNPDQRLATAAALAERLETLDARIAARRQQREDEARAQREAAERAAAEARAAALARRNKLLRGALAAAAAVLVVVTGLAVYARQQHQLAEARRAEADEQRQEAVAASKLADDRFNVALEAVQALVFEVQDKVKNHPNTRDLRESLLKEAKAKLEKLTAETNKGPAGRAAWGIAKTRGDLALRVDRNAAAAESEYAAAARLAEQLAAAEPTNVQAQHDLWSSVARLGDAAAEQGQAAQAKEHFHKCLAGRQRLAEQDPSPKSQRNLAATLSRLGELALLEADVEAARAHVQKAWEAVGSAVASDVGDAEAQRGLAVVASQLGVVAMHQGNATAAAERHAEALARRRKLAAGDPASAQAQRDVSNSLVNLGDVARKRGDGNAALLHYQEALALRRKLAEDDPSDLGVLQDAAGVHERVGDLHARQGHAEAARHYEQGADICRKLLKLDARNAGAARTLAYALDRLAGLAMREPNPAAARTLRTEALELRQRLAAADPASVPALRDVVSAHANLATLEAAEGNFAAVAERYRAALAAARGSRTPQALGDTTAVLQTRLAAAERMPAVLADPAAALAAANPGELLAARAGLLAQRGDARGLQATAQAYAAAAGKASADRNLAYSVAWCWALAAAAAERDAGLPKDQRPAFAEAARREALKWLRAAADRGFANALHVEAGDPAMAPLRSAPEFPALLAAIRANAAKAPAVPALPVKGTK